MNRRRWWTSGAVVVTLAISAAILWWALPGLVRWLVVRQIEVLTHRTARVERLDLDLARGRLDIAGLRLADRQAGPPVAEVDRLGVRFDPRSLLRGHVWIREAMLEGVRARIVRSERGELNIADLLARTPGREGPFALTVDRLSLADGTALVEDRTRAPVLTWRAEHIAVEASALSTGRPDAQGSARVTASVDGAPIAIEVSELRLAPLHLRGRLRLQEVDATLAGIALPADTPIVLERAVLTADLAASLDAREGIRLDGQGRVDRVALRSRATANPLATMPSLTFALGGTRTDASGGPFRLGHIEVTGTATLFDARNPSTGRFEVDRLRLRVEDVEGPGPATARIVLTAGLPGGGDLEVQGPARLAPLGAELRTRLRRLDPAILASYVALPVQLSGVIESDLTLDVAYAGAVTARIRGVATVTNAAITDGGRPIASARQIEVTGIDGSWPRIGVTRIRLVQPAAVIERDRAGQIPLAALFTPARPAPGPERGARASAARPSGPAIQIGEIAAEQGTMTLDDATVVPPARLTLAALRLSARDVTWPAGRPGTVHLEAATPGSGTLEATGTVSLDPLRLEVRARLAGAALAPYQGYLPFAARIQGNLHADVNLAASLGARPEVGARGTAALSDLSVADGARPFARAARVETTGLEYTWPTTLKVDRLHVQRPRARIERQPDGVVPLRAIVAPSSDTAAREPRPTTATGIALTVREAVLDDGGVRIVDRAVNPAAGFDVTGVRLVAREVTWPARRPTAVELQAVWPGGGSVSARGEVNLAPARANLTVSLRGVDLTPAQPYLPVHGRMAAKATGDLEVTATLDPLALSARGAASLDGVSVTDGDRPLLTVARMETAGLDYRWPATVTIDRLHVQRSHAAIEHRPDGTFPLAMLFGASRAPDGTRPAATAPAATGTAAPPLDVTIRESVLDGAATIIDGAVTPAARFEVAGVQLVARDFTWPSRRPTAVELRAPMPGGGTLSAHGQLGLAPARLDLEVALNDVDVAPAQPYLALRGRIAGKASGQMKVSATIEPLAITARGAASVANLAVADGTRPLLTAERLETTGVDYSWPATVTVDRLRVQKPWLLIEQRADGVLSLEGLLPPGRAEPGAVRRQASSATGAAAAPQISVRRSLLENGAATIVASRAGPAGRLEITGARLTARDLAWPARGTSALVLRAPMPGGGTLEARGQLRLDTSGLETTVVLDRVDLASLQPFVPLRGRIAGRANADLSLKGTLTPLAVSVMGRLAVMDASLGDGQRALATVKRVDIAGLNTEWPRRRVTIERIGLREPWSLVERDASGTMPLLALITPDSTDADGASARTGRSGTPGLTDDAPVVRVGMLVVEDGFIRFSDRTTRPTFVEEASRLAVTVRGLGTALATRSELTATARLTGGAPVEIRGEVGPLGGPLFLDVEGKVSSFALNRINPYANRLLGWVARRGAVGVTFHYRVRDDHLEATNEVVLGQPEFVPSRRGDEVRERVGVPLDLLVSLLKNARQEVHFSVPVTGTISSRQFDFGDAVWDAVRKAAINVLALPVSWVGKIFYTADARIDTIRIWPVAFEPGTTRMQRGIEAHAERLTTFLRQTPAVMFTLKPVMTVDDVSALKRDAVRQRIDALAREAGPPEAKAVAARLFAERFPGRPVPAELEALVEALAREEPAPDGPLRTLATRRLELTRRELQAKGGVDPARLRMAEGVLPVEASGPARVEFEMAPDSAPAP